MMWKRHLTFALALYLILGTWKGYVALFEPGSQEPRQIFPCQVDSLPEQDQQALEKGIPMRNPRDLNEALEDFLS